MIKNIIFDFGGVVLDNLKDKDGPNKKVFYHFVDNDEDMNTLCEAMIDTSEWFKLDQGTIPLKDAIKIMQRRLPQKLKKPCYDFMTGFWNYQTINKNIYKVMQKLKEHNYHIYILSNTRVPVYHFIKNSDISKYIDGYVISAIEKVRKPHNGIYNSLFYKFNLKPEECYFIDDLKANINASKSLGMNGHIFDEKANISSLISDFNKYKINIA